MNNLSRSNICSMCGVTIKNIVTIDGKSYGTDCATKVLGINNLPSWFKGGDWDSAKLDYDMLYKKRVEDFKLVKQRTSKHWSEYIRLSKALHSASVRGNDWEVSFITSISNQTGLPNLIGREGLKFETMEDAELGWNTSYFGSFPYIERDISGINGLSQKQIDILERIESKK